MIVGLTLLPTAFTSNIYPATETLSANQNMLLAAITAAILILFSMLGDYFPGMGKYFRSSVRFDYCIGYRYRDCFLYGGR